MVQIASISILYFWKWEKCGFGKPDLSILKSWRIHCELWERFLICIVANAKNIDIYMDMNWLWNEEPSSKMEASSILYHPQSGECLKKSKTQNQVEAGGCSKASGWSQEGSQIKLKGQNEEYCVKASGAGQAVILTADCSNTNQTSWKAITESGMHWTTVDAQGNSLCLHKDANSSTILTNKCICADTNPACLDNPQSQWFQFVSTNVDA